MHIPGGPESFCAHRSCTVTVTGAFVDAMLEGAHVVYFAAIFSTAVLLYQL